jgi:diacylglycerol kinase (ATP)
VDPGRVRVIVNPAAGRGRGARALGAIRTAFATHGYTDLVTTARAGDEARLVHECLDDGVATIVVAGGDGTWSKCAVALARAGSLARMGFLAAGTGNDFAKNLRAPAGDPRAMARLVASGGVLERRVDMGRVDDEWFLNVAGFGFDVAVLRATSAKPVPLLRGPALYVVTAIGQLIRCKGIRCEVRSGASSGAGSGAGYGEPSSMQSRLLLVFSNGAHFGGAFHIAPGATVDDGALDAILVEDAEAGVTSAARRAMLLARALRGTHLQDPHVEHRRDARFDLRFEEAPWFEVDGELRRAKAESVEVALIPGVLRVLDAPPAPRQGA